MIWGAGSKGVAFLSMLGVGDEVDYAVDVNPGKHGMFMPGTGHEIVSPNRLEEATAGPRRDHEYGLCRRDRRGATSTRYRDRVADCRLRLDRGGEGS